MKYIQTWLSVIIFLICTPLFADNMNDPFEGVVAKYLAANPKPQLPEEAHKFKVQAEFAVQEKSFSEAAELYGKALDIAPWWPEGHFNRALILGETKDYWNAMREMKRYLLLVPDASNARAAQDKIYLWEGVDGPEREGQDCPKCPEMAVIPAGSFDMGSDNGDSDEKPVHRVTIAKPFAIGKTEVTQGQWKSIMGNNPSYFNNCGDNCPVEGVSWNDTQEYIRKLNIKTGKQYRLPSEAEWEYACRAGGQREYCGSDNVDSVAWYFGPLGGNSGASSHPLGGQTHPVAGKQANAFGIYDMSGNVLEWVEDGYHHNYKGAPTDGSVWHGDRIPAGASASGGIAWQEDSSRVLRSGIKKANGPRAAIRYRLGAADSNSIFIGPSGFRVARTRP